MTARREMGPTSGGCKDMRPPRSPPRKQDVAQPSPPRPCDVLTSTHQPQKSRGGFASPRKEPPMGCSPRRRRAGPSLSAGGFQGLCPHWPQTLSRHITKRAWDSVITFEEPAFLLRHLSPLDETPSRCSGQGSRGGGGGSPCCLPAGSPARPTTTGCPLAPQRTSQVTALSVESWLRALFGDTSVSRQPWGLADPPAATADQT